MRIAVACVFILLACHPGIYAQPDTMKKSSNSTASSIIADINLMYDNMEQAIKLEYTRLVKENKKKTDELTDKIKGVDQQVEKLKELGRKIEEVAARMEALMAKMMEQIGNDRQKINQWLNMPGVSDHTNRLKIIRDSIIQNLPVQIAQRKDSLIKVSQIHL